MHQCTNIEYTNIQTFTHTTKLVGYCMIYEFVNARSTNTSISATMKTDIKDSIKTHTNTNILTNIITDIDIGTNTNTDANMNTNSNTNSFLPILIILIWTYSKH